MWTLVIMFFFHLICAVVIIVWGVEESTVLIGELSQTFLRLVYDWDEDPRSSRILKQIMEYVSRISTSFQCTQKIDSLRSDRLGVVELMVLTTSSTPSSQYRTSAGTEF